MRSILLCISILGLVGCGEFPEKASIKTVYGQPIKALGHGGMGSRALIPMNSWGSLEECFSLNPDGTELDIQLTKDGVLVCYHDKNLDKGTTCQGKMSDVTWEELTQGCEYSTWSSSKEFARLDSVISKFGKPGMILSLDLKESSDERPHNLRMRGQIQRMVLNHPDIIFFVETWDQSGMWGFDGIEENLMFFQLCVDAASGFQAINQNSFNGISIDYRNVTAEDVQKLHQMGFFVMLYGANTASGNKKAVSLSADFIQSDRLDHLITGLERYGW